MLPDAELALAAGGPLRLGGRFWRYAIATTASGIGDGVRFAALPLLAASLTRSPVLVAAVATAEGLPWVLVNPISGVLIDRHDRRQMMRWSAEVRVALVLILVAAILTHLVTIWWLCGLGFLLGCADTFGSNASIGLLPALVAAAQLERANAVSQGIYNVGTTLLGPAIGGLLFTVTVTLPFGVDIAAFVAVIVLLAGLRGDFRAESAPGAASGIRAELWEGMAWLVHHRVLRNLALLVGAMNLAFGMIVGILVLFVLETLHLPRGAYGLLLATFAVGGLLGTGLAVRYGARLRSTLVLRLVLLVEAGGAGAVAAWPTLGAVIPAFCAIGLFSTLWDVVVVSYRQRVVPAALIGRVTGAFRVVGMGATPVGTILGGVIAGAMGLRAPFIAAALILVLATLMSVPGLGRGSLDLASDLPERPPGD
ncbi:MAG TPA: MFS transporter [Candidatus Dormibacteraeota bacterium]